MFLLKESDVHQLSLSLSLSLSSSPQRVKDHRLLTLVREYFSLHQSELSIFTAAIFKLHNHFLNTSPLKYSYPIAVKEAVLRRFHGNYNRFILISIGMTQRGLSHNTFFIRNGFCHRDIFNLLFVS